MKGLLTAMVFGAGIAPPIVVDEPMNGQVVHAAQGATLVVRLSTQPGTGYAWSVRAQAKTLVAVGAGTLESVGAGTPVTGGGEAQVFQFRVKSRGKGVLRLAYARPWESEKPAARTFSVVVDSR